MVSAKYIFIEWLLQINLAIGQKLCNSLGKIEGDNYSKSNNQLDIRNISPFLKKTLIYDQDVLDMRWSLCKGCEFLTESNSCTHCGCFMKTKHKFAYASCPIGKWDKHITKIESEDIQMAVK